MFLVQDLASWVGSPQPDSDNQRLLDVGCGYGDFMRLAKEAGWMVEGTELSPEMVKVAGRVCGGAVYQGTLGDLQLPGGRYSAITYWNVLNQVRKASEELRESHRLLQPGGMLMLRIPNGGFHRHWLRLRDKHPRFCGVISGSRDFTPAHPYLFTPFAIQRWLETYGFELKEICGCRLSSRHPLAQVWSTAIMALNHLGGRGRFISPSLRVRAIKVR
jgi:2-polyprenyl-3-methyl-5-hydroxy-6-metoxy-1,4-benzoquinol methylase